MLNQLKTALAMAAVCLAGTFVHAQPQAVAANEDINGTGATPPPQATTNRGSPPAQALPIGKLNETPGHGSPISTKTSVNNAQFPPKTLEKYFWIDSASQYISELDNKSGQNLSKNNNEGRTGISAYRSFIRQNGNGDAGAYYANCQIGGPGNVGATHWLAQPACVILNGDVGTTVPHSYLNVQEFSLSDNRRDVAAIGTVYRFERTNNAAGQGEIWMGVRNQSIGTKSVDVGISNAGLINIGLDTVMARAEDNFLAGKMVAVNMAAEQRIVYNSKSHPLNGVEWFGNQIGSAYDTFSQSENSLKRCNQDSCLSVGTGNVRIVNAGLRLTIAEAAKLPVCDRAAEGTLYSVSDAKSESYNADLEGDGPYHVMAYCNGTHWKVR